MVGVRPGADTTVPFWKYLLGIEISACHRWRVGAAGRFGSTYEEVKFDFLLAVHIELAERFVRTYKQFDRQCRLIILELVQVI